MNKYYSRELKMPVTKQDGLRNVVQMIINQIENGDTQEALYTAVNLLDDLRCKSDPYEIASQAPMYQRLEKEMATSYANALKAAHETAFKAGQDYERQELSKKLGLLVQQ